MTALALPGGDCTEKRIGPCTCADQSVNAIVIFSLSVLHICFESMLTVRKMFRTSGSTMVFNGGPAEYVTVPTAEFWPLLYRVKRSKPTSEISERRRLPA